jgi:hypothetical protein
MYYFKPVSFLLELRTLLLMHTFFKQMLLNCIKAAERVGRLNTSKHEREKEREWEQKDIRIWLFLPGISQLLRILLIACFPLNPIKDEYIDMISKSETR